MTAALLKSTRGGRTPGSGQKKHVGHSSGLWETQKSTRENRKVCFRQGKVSHLIRAPDEAVVPRTDGPGVATRNWFSQGRGGWGARRQSWGVLYAWKPACTSISTEETYSAETGEKRSGVLGREPSQLLPTPSRQCPHCRSGRESCILETRPATAEMTVRGWDQPAVQARTGHRRSAIEGPPKFLVLFWPVLLNEIGWV